MRKVHMSELHLTCPRQSDIGVGTPSMFGREGLSSYWFIDFFKCLLYI